MLELQEEKAHFLIFLSLSDEVLMKFMKNYCWTLAQIRETFHEEINLQQVASETIFVWPLNKGRYVSQPTL